MHVKIESLTKRYGDMTAVDDLSLEIADGEFLVLLGPSGCGKTTTMRSIVGLESPSIGRITVGDTVMFDNDHKVNVPPNRRHMGMVFQSYAIWPHKTVFQNVSFPLEMQRTPRGETRTRVGETLELVGLSGLGDRGASDLSGGQMQRVALARSLVMRPKVLLLDEPLSNLDAKLRESLRFELKLIQQELGTTSVYVTHDQAEALALADRVAVMKDGKIVQLADPVTVYKSPATAFVADFLGASNLLSADLMRDGSGCRVKLVNSDIVLRTNPHNNINHGEKATASIRPEDIRIRSGEPAGPSLGATVKIVNFLGSQVRYLIAVDSGPDLHVVDPGNGTLHRAGDRISVDIPAEYVQVLTD